MVEVAESLENIPWLALDLANDQAVHNCLHDYLISVKSLKDWEKR